MNPAANVKLTQEGDFQPAIAIKTEVMGQFHSVTRTVSMQANYSLSGHSPKKT